MAIQADLKVLFFQPPYFYLYYHTGFRLVDIGGRVPDLTAMPEDAAAAQSRDPQELLHLLLHALHFVKQVPPQHSFISFPTAPAGLPNPAGIAWIWQ